MISFITYFRPISSDETVIPSANRPMLFWKKTEIEILAADSVLNRIIPIEKTKTVLVPNFF